MTVDFRIERDRALVRLENEKSRAVRTDAANALCDLAAELPDDEAVAEFQAALVRLLADRQTEVRCAGLALASQLLPDDEAEALFARHLSDADKRVRVEATGRLADLSLPSSRGALAPMLNDASLSVRFEAARGIASLKHSAGLEVLIEALDDTELRFRAAGVLAQLGDAKALPALKKLFSKWVLPHFDRTQVAGALAKLGESAGVEHLFKRSAKKSAPDRAMAIELLGEVKAAGAKERLLDVLKDKKDWCRGPAARGLGRLQDAQVSPTLIAALHEAGLSDDERLDFAEALLRLGTDDARSEVSKLQLESPEAREELLSMLEP